MKDILPREMEIRDYVIGQIKETYRTFGFQSIETPCVEHIENLNNKQGGENEKLIFMLSFSVVSLAVNDVFHELHGLRFIDIHKFPVAHNPFPVYHTGTDVFAIGRINDS